MLLGVYLISLSATVAGTIAMMVASSTETKIVHQVAQEDGSVATMEQRFSNGILKWAVRVSSQGLYHGIAVSYYDNGSVEAIGHWHHGKWDGVWTHYDEQGHPCLKTEYVKGQFMRHEVLTTLGWVTLHLDDLPKTEQLALRQHEYGPQEGPKKRNVRFILIRVRLLRKYSIYSRKI